jgi:hypothetical protein
MRGRALARDVFLFHERLADGVEHEHGIDDPDARGEVGAAFLRVGVATGEGAVLPSCSNADGGRHGVS